MHGLVALDKNGDVIRPAILAMTAAGEYCNVAEACRSIIKVRETIEPDLERADMYEEKYRIFRRLYPALRDVFPEWERRGAEV